MTTHTVYWVGLVKHGQIQFLVAGPFADLEQAGNERDLRSSAKPNAVYRLAEQTIEVEELL